MARVVIYKGESKYGVMRRFADELAQGFAALGHEAVAVDLTGDFRPALARAYERPVAFALGFNGLGAEMALAGGALLHNEARVPYVAVLVDHPMNCLGRLDCALERFIVTCVDRTHLDFLQWQYGERRRAHFLPHGGCRLDAPPEGDERPIDILFAGSYQSPAEFQGLIAQLPEPLASATAQAAERALASPEVPLFSHLRLALAQRRVSATPESVDRWGHALRLVDHVVRTSQRVRLLGALATAGVSVEIAGEGWERFPLAHAHRLRPPVDLVGLLELMHRSKLVLNFGLAFPDGAHERVFAAMLAGALAVSEQTGYLAEAFTEEQLETFRWAEVDALPARLRELLADPAGLARRAAAGREAALRAHTWQARAQALVELVSQA